MATLTMAQLLSLPADVTREAEAAILEAMQNDQVGDAVPMAMTMGLQASAFTLAPALSPWIAGFAWSGLGGISVGSGGGPPPRAAHTTINNGFPAPEENSPLSDGLRDPEVKKRAYEDIKALAENIRSARASMEPVTALVRDVDDFIESMSFQPSMFMAFMPMPWLPSPVQQTPPLLPKWVTITQV